MVAGVPENELGYAYIIHTKKAPGLDVDGNSKSKALVPLTEKSLVALDKQSNAGSHAGSHADKKSVVARSSAAKSKAASEKSGKSEGGKSAAASEKSKAVSVKSKAPTAKSKAASVVSSKSSASSGSGVSSMTSVATGEFKQVQKYKRIYEY